MLLLIIVFTVEAFWLEIANSPWTFAIHDPDILEQIDSCQINWMAGELKCLELIGIIGLTHLYDTDPFNLWRPPIIYLPISVTEFLMS